MAAKCSHDKFHGDVAVNKMVDTGGFMVDVRIKCSDCNMSFRFQGLKIGLDMAGASMSVDGTEARLAIVPADESGWPVEPQDGKVH